MLRFIFRSVEFALQNYSYFKKLSYLLCPDSKFYIFVVGNFAINLNHYNIMALIRKIFNFYVTGFKEMTIGKTLWILILVKLFIIFFILKLFFFPNFLNNKFSTDEDRSSYVRHELINE